MMWHLTPEDVERARRIARDPFDSGEVRVSVYAEPVASNDGLFRHGANNVPCHACQPDPTTGEPSQPHAHLVVAGANGGIRCEPIRLSRIAQRHLRRFGADALVALVNLGLLFSPLDPGDRR